MANQAITRKPPPRYLLLIFAALLAIVAIPFAWGGIKLVGLGGSAYYLIASLAYLITAFCFARRLRQGVWLLIATFLATIIWALAEVGVDFWQLVPRLVIPAVLFMLGICVAPLVGRAWSRRAKLTSYAAGGVVFVALLATLGGAFVPHGSILATGPAPIRAAVKDPDPTTQNWEYYGRNAGGTRYAPFTQINRDNVSDLKVAWTYRTGRRITGKDPGVDQNTPMQIGNTLYSCTPFNVISALDADTGKERWKFDPKANTDQHISCRGLGYYDASVAKTIAGGELDRSSGAAACMQRIVITTVDARLITLDAKTGTPCADFGTAGSVDLTVGMGDTDHSNLYHPTSAPTVMGNLVIVGGWVWDVQHGEPSGVLRAFDARNGALVWAWDVGNLGHNGAPPEGGTYTLGTPNVWASPGFDTELGLIYAPTGNGPPDYWGGDRSDIMDKYGSAIVALDAKTGKTQWSFQTTHHDVWDYDVPSQPTLYDMDDGKGNKVPALIQTTKRGQIFILDRRTGVPISAVEEKAVPQSPVAEGEHLAPTQPYSVDMPVIGAAPLTEKGMWGVSSFDQLWCRIDFLQHEYQGDFTPPSVKPYLLWPGLLGGMNWGGASIDEATGRLFVNNINVPIKMSLVTRADAEKRRSSTAEVPTGGDHMRPQLAGPFGGVNIEMMMSPLGVPCNAPPFGTLSAIDLKTRSLAWQVPMGSVEDTGPMGIKTGLHIPLGMPTLGGPTSTAGDLVFYAGTQDYYLRAMDSSTGKEVWRGRLPVGAVSAPLIYVSPETGRQYVVISAGGVSYSKDRGDYIIAYALPQKGEVNGQK